MKLLFFFLMFYSFFQKVVKKIFIFCFIGKKGKEKDAFRLNVTKLGTQAFSTNSRGQRKRLRKSKHPWAHALIIDYLRDFSFPHPEKSL